MIITHLNAVPRGHYCDTCTAMAPARRPAPRAARVSGQRQLADTATPRPTATRPLRAHPITLDDFPRVAPREPPAERQCQAPPAPGDALPVQPGPRYVMSAVTLCLKQGSPAGRGQM